MCGICSALLGGSTSSSSNNSSSTSAANNAAIAAALNQANQYTAALSQSANALYQQNSQLAGLVNQLLSSFNNYSNANTGSNVYLVGNGWGGSGWSSPLGWGGSGWGGSSWGSPIGWGNWSMLPVNSWNGVKTA